ncbi:MAG TPA: GAF domain-containing sensor histidine kinase [Thermoplasmata archaeon]|nr:GAF domain-containing sensor histidine kinase [Thermoplasmata archaeon]
MVEAKSRSARLLETGMALASELSLPVLLQRIVELAVDVTAARYGALGVIGPDGDLVDFLTTGISDEERARIGALPRGRGLLGALIADARPLRLEEISRDPRSAGFPPHHPPMHTFLGAPVRARGKVFGNLYLTEKQGASDFTAEDEEALVTLATQAGIAISNARLYEEAQVRERWLQAVREATGAILAGAEVESVLRLVARWARELAGADLATVVIPGAAGEDMAITVAEGMRSDGLEGLVVPLDGSLSGEVIRSGEPLVLEDASSDTRSYQPMVGSGRMGPSLFVPLTVRGKAFGTLAVANEVGGRRFTDEDVRLVETFAGQASLGLEYGRVQAEIQRLTLLEDRERIAKELHDGVIQALFAVGLSLQGTAAIVAERRVGARLQDAVNEIDRVIGDLRSYIFGLRPHVLASARGLGAALDQIAHEFESTSGVTTVVELDESLEGPLADNAVHIVQLAREALSNVGKHARAQTCRLSLRRAGSEALLEVDDDGTGFDLAAALESGGMGLGNLRSRAGAIGGALDITSAPGEGSTIRVTLPL